MTAKGDTYTCAECGGTFTTDWSDEEALDELEDNFSVPPEQCAVVCDDCYKLIMGRVHGDS